MVGEVAPDAHNEVGKYDGEEDQKGSCLDVPPLALRRQRQHQVHGDQETPILLRPVSHFFRQPVHRGHCSGLSPVGAKGRAL